MTTNEAVERHYASEGIAERILAALRAERGPDLAVTPEALAPLDQFHGGGLSATRALIGDLAPQAGERLLDLGCGVGGPARWVAATFGCHVTGIDLTHAFRDAAETLSAACALSEVTRFVQGDATELPFADAQFHRAWSHNALMNIADKRRFYREAFRVLRPGGALAVAQVVLGPNGPPGYPQPWARESHTSFLSQPADVRADAQAAGFIIEACDFTAPRRGSADPTMPSPRLGLHVLMGRWLEEARRNGIRDAGAGRMASMQCLLRKPG